MTALVTITAGGTPLTVALDDADPENAALVFTVGDVEVTASEFLALITTLTYAQGLAAAARNVVVPR